MDCSLVVAGLISAALLGPLKRNRSCSTIAPLHIGALAQNLGNGEKISNCVFISVRYILKAFFFIIVHNSLVFEHYFNTWPKTDFQPKSVFDKYPAFLKNLLMYLKF